MSSSFSVAQQREQSDGTGTLPRFTKAKVWRVLHACEYARDVLPVVEGQVAAGMRPYIVTPQGGGTAGLYLAGKNQEQPRAGSLLRSWQDGGHWRKSLLDWAPWSPFCGGNAHIV